MNDLAMIARPAAARSEPVLSRFDPVSIALHWTTVALLVAMFASAWSLDLVRDDELSAGLLTLHRSVGVTLWVVAFVRLGWRLSFGAQPPLPATVSRLQDLAAAITEGALYVLLLIQPLTGLAQSVTRGQPFRLFLFEAPTVMAKDKPLSTLLHQIHGLSAWLLLGLIGVHVLAAFFHRFVLKDTVLQSMLPRRRPHA